MPKIQSTLDFTRVKPLSESLSKANEGAKEKLSGLNQGIKRKFNDLSTGLTTAHSILMGDKKVTAVLDLKKPALKVATLQKPTLEPSPGSRCVYAWLNSLSDGEALKLHQKINMPESVPKQFLSPKLIERLSKCTNISSPERDGAFYLSWLECQISSLAPTTNSEGWISHPRVRINIPQRKQRTSETYSVVSSAVSPEHLQTFELLAPSKPGVTGYSNRQVRIGVHHIAYNADRGRSNFTTLEKCGKQNSVSHRCDRCGCVRLDHLEFVTSHGDNNSRQRCRGMILVVDRRDGKDVILQEQPCVHAGSFGITDPTLTACCRRVCIVPLGTLWPELKDQWT